MLHLLSAFSRQNVPRTYSAILGAREHDGVLGTKSGSDPVGGVLVIRVLVRVEQFAVGLVHQA